MSADAPQPHELIPQQPATTLSRVSLDLMRKTTPRWQRILKPHSLANSLDEVAANPVTAERDEYPFYGLPAHHK